MFTCLRSVFPFDGTIVLDDPSPPPSRRVKFSRLATSGHELQQADIQYLQTHERATDAGPSREQVLGRILLAKSVANYVNERKREAENHAKLSEIHSILIGKYDPLYAANRRFIKEGVFLDSKKKKEVVIFLFTDLLVWGKPTKKLLNSKSEIIKENGKDKEKLGGYKVKFKNSLSM